MKFVRNGTPKKSKLPYIGQLDGASRWVRILAPPADCPKMVTLKKMKEKREAQ